MRVADAAPGLADVLTKLSGMLHADVNYAAGLAFVAYDSNALKREAIEQAMHGMGVKVLPTQPVVPDTDHDHAEHPVKPTTNTNAMRTAAIRTQATTTVPLWWC